MSNLDDVKSKVEAEAKKPVTVPLWVLVAVGVVAFVLGAVLF